MISLALEPVLLVPVPWLNICAWVMVGRGEGGREELRDKMVMGEGLGSSPLLLDPCIDSSCLNLVKGETGLCLSSAFCALPVGFLGHPVELGLEGDGGFEIWPGALSLSPSSVVALASYGLLSILSLLCGLASSPQYLLFASADLLFQNPIRLLICDILLFRVSISDKN